MNRGNSPTPKADEKTGGARCGKRQNGGRWGGARRPGHFLVPGPRAAPPPVTAPQGPPFSGARGNLPARPPLKVCSGLSHTGLVPAKPQKKPPNRGHSLNGVTVGWRGGGWRFVNFKNSGGPIPDWGTGGGERNGKGEGPPTYGPKPRKIRGKWTVGLLEGRGAWEGGQNMGASANFSHFPGGGGPLGPRLCQENSHRGHIAGFMRAPVLGSGGGGTHPAAGGGRHPWKGGGDIPGPDRNPFVVGKTIRGPSQRGEFFRPRGPRRNNLNKRPNR